jgi:hypothetical protein
MSALVAVAALLAGCRSRTVPPVAAGATDGGPTDAKAQAERNPFARFKADPEIPFTAKPQEVTSEHLCGPSKRRPCILLSDRYSSWKRRAVVWFLTTDGREYIYTSTNTRERDVFGKAAQDGKITVTELTEIVAASEALPARVTPIEVNHALILIEKSRGEPVDTIDEPAVDGGVSFIAGYLVDAHGDSSPVPLQTNQGFSLLEENRSPAAREISQWVHHLRKQARPLRPR